MMNEYGSALTMPIVWMAVKLSFPPATSNAVAVAPSVKAQNTRCTAGGSGIPFAERQSITSDPESDEVTKYNMIASKENTDKKFPIPV